MKKATLESMLKMWKEVIEDEEGGRVIDFMEVHGDDLEGLLETLIKEPTS